MIEGSAFVQNIGIIHKKLAERNNQQDRVILIDISHEAITSHRKFINNLTSKEKYQIIQADMNHIPLKDQSTDIIINDCAINFNVTDDQNMQTIKEMKRVMKPKKSVALFSVVVPRKFDDMQFGQNQELIPREQIDISVDFYPLSFSMPSTEISRKCWPLPYYKSLLDKAKFKSTEFDDIRGKSYFPLKSQISYRRFLLEK